MDIDPVLISSICHNLSISQNPKRVLKRKAEDELATLISAPEKGPRMVAASDILLAWNPVSDFSLVGKSSTKVLRCHGGSINYIADTSTIKWSGRMFYCHNGTYSELRIILQHVKSLLDLSAPSGFKSQEKTQLSS